MRIMARGTRRNGNGARRSRAREENVKEYDALIRWASAIVLLAGGVLLLLALFGAAGPVGAVVFTTSYAIVGIGAFLLPIALIAVGLYAGFGRPSIELLTASGLLLICASVLAFAGLFPSTHLGGGVGTWGGEMLAGFFGFWGALVLLLATIAVGIAIVSDIEALGALLGENVSALWERMRSRRGDTGDEAFDEEGVVGVPEDDADDAYEDEETEGADGAPVPEHEPVVTVFNRTAGAAVGTGIANFDAEYDPPPLSILGADRGKPGVGDIKANANIIKRTFQNFGIHLEMDEVSVGPTVTRYAVKPAEGVRLSKIVSLANNLELALAAHPVRIEAPIPGKSLVGIEVPNTTKAMVGLGGLLTAPEWSASTKPLLAALGRDITGTPHYANIAKMPHALVAGATGSGKSVAIHALVTSLLYRNGPNQLRFIMIDPKRVELTAYNGIPHLLTPVITDPKKTIFSLKWAAKEMERRYNILEAEKVRDIESYHSTIFEPAKKSGAEEMPEALPYIVIVIDELADIMHSYPRELEASIVRLAQMSRAVGIHLILSTQRPSVNVITGLIKANVPTRMALQVASQIDSRTILDGAGAETLLGAGDMLYLSSDMQKPVRIQTAFISEGEVKKVVNYIKSHNAGDLSSIDFGGNGAGAEPNDVIGLTSGSFDDDDIDDDLYEEARIAVEEAGRASTSYLQRKLKIGYSRAARLMDVLEAHGVIGPADGSKPREILTRSGAAPAVADTDADEETASF
ncbi:MAG TPA: DNA translocase FtsK 4TM domain-containing protein [Candidatus Paceibacterota bacterium]|nr:DNA translocase FtsK 4TM domain-containing protein [Candidatus Paceibacterota bacterium]